MDSAFCRQTSLSAGFFVPKEVEKVKRRKHTQPARLPREQLEQYRLLIVRLEQDWANGAAEEFLRQEYRQLRLDLLFTPEEGTKEFSDVIWSEDGRAGFADFWKEVREFAPYRYLCEKGETAVKTLVRLEET